MKFVFSLSNTCTQCTGSRVFIHTKSFPHFIYFYLSKHLFLPATDYHQTFDYIWITINCRKF